ncbi:hypothetical protein DFH29DRAFT_878670 [Suillus ampliporus]|nr:hypothetical protein DFH29DRAFT_878670 [Suillus ampliporus]
MATGYDTSDEDNKDEDTCWQRGASCVCGLRIWYWGCSMRMWVRTTRGERLQLGVGRAEVGEGCTLRGCGRNSRNASLGSNAYSKTFAFHGVAIPEAQLRERMGHVQTSLSLQSVMGGMLNDYQLEGLQWMHNPTILRLLLSEHVDLRRTIMRSLHASEPTGQDVTIKKQRTGQGKHPPVKPLRRSVKQKADPHKTARQMGLRRTAYRQMKTTKIPDIDDTHIPTTSDTLPPDSPGKYYCIRLSYIVVDEEHKLKNLDPKLTQEIKKYPSAGWMILTGTPLHPRRRTPPRFQLLGWVSYPATPKPNAQTTKTSTTFHSNQINSSNNDLIAKIPQSASSDPQPFESSIWQGVKIDVRD